MPKMSQLAAELDELRHCGEVLIGISDTLREMFSGGDDMTVTQETPAEKPKGKAKAEKNSGKRYFQRMQEQWRKLSKESRKMKKSFRKKK